MFNTHQHSTPLVSILSGSILGVTGYLQQKGFDFDNVLEIIKVISYGILGGSCGYIGRAMTIKVHQYLKQKSKDACENK